MQKSKIISAVHTPMPFRALNSRITSSSGFCQMPSKSNSPFWIFRAKSVMYSALRQLMPSSCNCSFPASRICSASTVPRAPRMRCQMVACALVEICCPTIWCTTAENRSVSTSRFTRPTWAITAPSFSSLPLRYSVSSCPY